MMYNSTMMDLNMAFHEEAQRQVCNINQLSLKNIPLKSVIRERVRVTESLACSLASFTSLQRDARDTPPRLPAL